MGFRMTETGTYQARQEEQTVIMLSKENSFFKINQLSKCDWKYNGNEVTYLFFSAARYQTYCTIKSNTVFKYSVEDSIMLLCPCTFI